jgi:XTP/dITP diphosphohydrolase
MLLNSIVIASNNKHKIAEIKAILKDRFDNIYSLSDIGLEIDVVEDGETFFENALKKAKEVSKASGMIALADDSGLCVEALGGEPAVQSAYFAGKPCNNAANNALLLKAMDGVVDRRAKYAATIVIYYPDGKIEQSYGETHGTILEEHRGLGGFGYDSLFFSDDLQKTFAEATEAEKNSVSHRYRALSALSSVRAV